ncbi:MAG: hypothetical protein ACREDR_10350 [Blastocatellia bacterium]
MRNKSLMFTSIAAILLSASVSYAVGLEIVKDPWNVAETHSGFASTIAKLADLNQVADNHYQYVLARDKWSDPLQVADQMSRLASLTVKVRQETGWGTPGVLAQKLPNIDADNDHIQDVIERGDAASGLTLRDNLGEVYGDPTTGGVDRSYRDMTSAYLQAGRTNQAINENLVNAAKTKAKLEDCGSCTQSDKDRLNTELSYYQTMAAQYAAQSSNQTQVLAADQAGMTAARINQENQNRWRERDQAAAIVRTMRVGVGPIVTNSRQD